jgi:hypothetical protein
MLDQVRASCGTRANSVRALLALALALLGTHGLAAIAFADVLIVDDADAAVQLSGSWEASATTPGFYGGGYLFHMPGRGAANVRWPFPTSAAAGDYRVYARWSSGGNRASAIVHRVTSEAGNAEIRANQQTGGGNWHLLGSFTFHSDANEGVSLSGDADGVVVADAIAWVGPVGSDTGVGLPDLSSAQPFQRAVDGGDQPWRLDPLEVARADTAAFGFGPNDPMDLIQEQRGAARVRAQHAETNYEIRLIQPARLGPSGIWIVTSVQPAAPAATP